MKKYEQRGFTLLELILVVAIIAILTAIAYPNYQSYIKRSKRVDMMTEMKNTASNIEAEKLAKGTYASIDVSSYQGNFPRQGVALYKVVIGDLDKSSKLEDGKWIITSTPLTDGLMSEDGTLTLTFDGQKCRIKSKSDKKCGRSTEWKD